MNREELLEALTSDILTYVMHGSFPEHHLAEQIKFEGLDERFDDYETLIRLHFVLRPDVVDFVEDLPKHLRQVKTQTENVSRTVRGQVEGRIDWNKTYRERYSTNPGDTSLFVCENRSENYDIDENIVLKRLLSVIYDTLAECSEYLREDYEWVTDRWKDNLELVDRMTDIFERNVHVKRIRDPAEYEPTRRMIGRAADSRSDLYREAASLLTDYRESLRGDENAILELLQETAITPDDDETLLELFVLFRYVEVIERLHDGEFRLRTIESGKQEVARIEADDDTEIVLYYDSSAGDRGLSFDSTPPEGKSDLSRHEMVQRKSLETVRQYFENERFDSRTGRPDVIVLEIDRGDTREYLITEVKNSTRKETIREGITETVEYLAFLQQGSEFVFDRETDFLGDGWNGVLVVQDIHDTETADFADQESQPIRILQASAVEDRLQDVVEQVM
ncbi:MAG: hypothetical protein ABEH66_04970 [Halobacteriales archaeon]